MTKSSPGRKGFLWLVALDHSQSSREFRTGTKTKAILLTGSLTVSCSASFLTQPWPACLRMVPPIVDRTYQINLQSRGSLTDIAVGLSGQGSSAAEVPSSLVTLGYVKHHTVQPVWSLTRNCSYLYYAHTRLAIPISQGRGLSIY